MDCGIWVFKNTIESVQFSSVTHGHSLELISLYVRHSLIKYLLLLWSIKEALIWLYHPCLDLNAFCCICWLIQITLEDLQCQGLSYSDNVRAFICRTLEAIILFLRESWLSFNALWIFCTALFLSYFITLSLAVVTAVLKFSDQVLTAVSRFLNNLLIAGFVSLCQDTGEGRVRLGEVVFSTGWL